jgi:hypothetical protein
MKGFPFRDANLILLAEIVLITGIFCMNGGDKVLQTRGVEHYHLTGNFAVSTWLGPLLFGSLSDASVIAVERFGWWLHIFTVFGFLCYLPYSKHLHIILAFPNTWYARLTEKGKMENMPEIQKEVRIMMGLSPLSAPMENPQPMEVLRENCPNLAPTMCSRFPGKISSKPIPVPNVGAAPPFARPTLPAKNCRLEK